MPTENPSIISSSSQKPRYVHLHVHTAYSLLEGALKIPDLIAYAQKHMMPAVATTDHNNLFGSLEFSLAAASGGIQPIIGVTLDVVEQNERGTLVLLAQNKTGYQNLLHLSSTAYETQVNTSAVCVSWSSLAEHSEGLIALTGGVKGLIGQALLAQNQSRVTHWVEQLKATFPDRLYVELMRHGLPEQIQLEPKFLAIADQHNLPLVATNDVHFGSRDTFAAHDALVCIADGRYVTEANRRRYTEEHYFKSAAEMEKLFSDIPEAIANTVIIAERCAVMSEKREPLLPSFETREGRDEDAEFVAIAREGLNKHLARLVWKDGMSEAEKDALSAPYRARLKFELETIIKMRYQGYFLIVSDFIRWAKEQGIPVGPGRGSGAGSVVAWAMQITDLDPLRFGLLFERFLNPERVSMPDFDIDFCQERRDEVITYVQQKYGTDRVAQIITFGKLQARAVLRDVGRVLQMPYSQVDRICKLIPFNPLAPVMLADAIQMDKELQNARDTDEQVAKLLDIGLQLEGLYRHASTHAAGVVIADRPLQELVPLYFDPRSSMPVTQYSMKYAETAGLVKFDFLGLKTLTIIDQACQLVRNRVPEFDIHTIPYDDPKTYAMLSGGHTTGVFQMESAGMRDALRKLKPDTIEDIIALISLYRPGPMENIPMYIARKHGREKPDYLHPKLEPILKETFGVMIYQEQVMQIAQTLSGYSLGGADLLRRAMGKKIKSEMDAQRDLFVKGAVKNAVSEQKANEIFDLVAKFAGYGFNKSHAAAYAVIGYQTAFLKANYPVEFLVACMNNDIGDTDKLNVYRVAALRAHIPILPPDVQASSARFSVETTRQNGEAVLAIRYGLGALKGVGAAAMDALATERSQNGAFKNLFDLASRCDARVLNKRQIESLAKAGAFDSLHSNRHQIFANASLLVRYHQEQARHAADNQVGLFEGFAEDEAIAPMPQMADIQEWDSDTRLLSEYEAIGFYLTSHPLDAFSDELERLGVTPFANLDDAISGERASLSVAGTIMKVTHRAANGKRFAYLQLSDPTGSAELSIFDERLIESKRDLLEGNQPLVVGVDARKDEGGVRLMAASIQSMQDYFSQRAYVVCLRADHVASIENLSQVLTKAEPGTATIELQIHTQNQVVVTLRLPERYTLSRSIKTALLAVPGIHPAAA